MSHAWDLGGAIAVVSPSAPLLVGVLPSRDQRRPMRGFFGVQVEPDETFLRAAESALSLPPRSRVGAPRYFAASIPRHRSDARVPQSHRSASPSIDALR